MLDNLSSDKKDGVLIQNVNLIPFPDGWIFYDLMSSFSLSCLFSVFLSVRLKSLSLSAVQCSSLTF